MDKRISISVLSVAALSFVLTACGTPTPTITPAPLAAVASPTTATVAEATIAATNTTEASPTAVVIAATNTVAASPTAVATTAPTSTTAASPTAVATAVATTAVPDTAVPSPTVADTVAAAAAATDVATTAAPVATQELLAGTQPATLKVCPTSSLTVGTDATYPPFESINETSGKIEGFDIDLLNAIGAKESITLDYHNALFDTIFTALSYGQYDAVISASTITDERKQTVNFSNPYFIAGQVIVVRAADFGKILTSADLAGKTIGVQSGTTGADAAHAIPNTKAVTEFDTAPKAFQALANGDVDAVVNDNVTSLSIILNNTALNLKIVGAPFTNENYGIALRKDCTDLLAKINDGLAKVISDGTYATIYAKYIGEQPSAAFQQGGAGLSGSASTPAATLPAATAPAATTVAATAAATVAATDTSATAAATVLSATMAATP
jgi:ABC-type amino acid transport substrate-binding protein